jgi:hypothetical protein
LIPTFYALAILFNRFPEKEVECSSLTDAAENYVLRNIAWVEATFQRMLPLLTGLVAAACRAVIW